MTPETEITEDEAKLIRSIVDKYRDTELEYAERLASNLAILFQSKKLSGLVHSVKVRAKDPSHLQDKLLRKMSASKASDSAVFEINPDNLFEKINDLAGVRLLHLHTAQFPSIDTVIKSLLDDEGYSIIEGPQARTWDDEYRTQFASYGVDTIESKRMYTSVHYVVQDGARRRRTAEIQVRTLAEELWGEVDHSINYPHVTRIHACQEQIKVLARLTSSCTRLVDSIYSSKSAAENIPPTT